MRWWIMATPRALGTVQNYLSEYNGGGKRQIDFEEAAQLYDFLARRLAYLYIEYNMWGHTPQKRCSIIHLDAIPIHAQA